MENPNLKPSFIIFLKKSVLELERVFLKSIPLLVRFESNPQVFSFPLCI